MWSHAHAREVDDPTRSLLENLPHQHAFVLAGRETLFLCHMPMLQTMVEHMYQLVLEVRLPESDMSRYVEAYDRRDPADVFYLVNADDEDNRMTILDLAVGRRRRFTADVWNRASVVPGKRFPPWYTSPDDKTPLPKLIDSTRVTVERVVHFRAFDLNLPRPESLTYLLFGRSREAHLHHYMTREPDFDEVVTVEAPGWLPAAHLEAGVPVNLPDIAADAPLHRRGPLLTAGSAYTARYGGMERVTGDGPDKMLPRFEITVDRHLWFNTSICNSVDPLGPVGS